MATALSITYGSTTLVLTSAPYGLLDGYTPQPAIESLPATPSDGSRILAVPTRAAIERVVVVITGATSALLQTNKTALELAFAQAQRRADTGVGDRVYLSYQPTGYSDAWRSELLGAIAVPLPDTADRIEWAKFKMAFVVTWSRRPYWEGPEAEVPLSNSLFAAKTGGVTVFNHDDGAAISQEVIGTGDGNTKTFSGTLAAPGVVLLSVLYVDYVIGGILYASGGHDDGLGNLVGEKIVSGTIFYVTGAWQLVFEDAPDNGSSIRISYMSAHVNWVSVAAASVTGTLPAPIRLEIQNTYDSATRAYTFYIGHNVFFAPGSLAHVLEGEAAAYASNGVPTDDADCSDGHYEATTWAGSAQVELIRWTLDTAALASYLGGYFRVFARLPGTIPAAWISVKSKVAVTIMSASAEVLLSTSAALQSLGVVQIPPWLPGETDFYPISLSLYARKTGGGALGIDFVQLIPLDGYRVYTPRGYGLTYGARLADDGMAGSVWSDGWAGGDGSERLGHYWASGQPLALWPGRDQRFYFLILNETGGSEIVRTSWVRIYYRPRRLAL